MDFEKLFYNMLDAKAKWLYTLPEWADILSEETRRELTKNGGFPARQSVKRLWAATIHALRQREKYKVLRGKRIRAFCSARTENEIKTADGKDPLFL